jgi:ABC-type nitrate/sulfonate/bicarbonate transport system substrate-binding protein
MRNSFVRWSVALCVCLLVSGAASAADADVVRIALDWTPNTNHTGIFVARALGFFAEEGLVVEVLEPTETASIPLVASGQSEFGVSMQEYVTMARAQEVPVVSIATLFRHNTSGFAAPCNRGITGPEDFENLRYAGWGSDLESVMIRTVMEGVGADFGTVTMINMGMLDFTTAVRRDLADFYWVFYGWQGIHAELQGIEFDFFPLPELAEVLDYYTPVIITRERMIEDRSDIVHRFLRGLARGYVYAALHPAEAADILLDHAPELDAELVHASQEWIAEQTLEDIDRWGWQEEIVWIRFADWALENGLIDGAIDPLAAYTNDFLPQGETQDGGE